MGRNQRRTTLDQMSQIMTGIERYQQKTFEALGPFFPRIPQTEEIANTVNGLLQQAKDILEMSQQII